jgi:hypothetical protein
MSVYVYSVCVALCVSSIFATGYSHVQRDLPTVCRIKEMPIYYKSAKG